jgi:hypothetical protein
MAELLALVKHDCPVCDLVLPALDAAGVRILSQSDEADTAAQAQRLGLSATPALDTDLAVSQRFDPEAVPALFLLDGDDEAGRVEGIDRAQIEKLAARAGVELVLDALPDFRPGCASRTRDPEVAASLAARRARAEGRIRARAVTVGVLEDVFEALHDRGVTDGLPVVPPTPERVVAALAGTSRDPQDVVGLVPPYDGEATVEKVAINAVMAGCPPEVLPIVLAAVEAACDPPFAMHGLLATTYPAGPTVVVSGPLADEVGMNSGVNALGQGNRANLTIGRALQLVVRNLGGGRPGVEDRAAHGQAGKISSCFAERIAGSPWPPLAVERGLAAGETGVLLHATEAPRIVIDQLAREPEGLCATLAPALEHLATYKQRFVFDALVVMGPEHARVFADAGWDRQRIREELFERTKRPAGELARGAGGSPEGIDPQFIADPDAPIPKFMDPSHIEIVHAGGEAGLFSMVYGSWVNGEIGSQPVFRSVEPWR